MPSHFLIHVNKNALILAYESLYCYRVPKNHRGLAVCCLLGVLESLFIQACQVRARYVTDFQTSSSLT